MKTKSFSIYIFSQFAFWLSAVILSAALSSCAVAEPEPEPGKHIVPSGPLSAGFSVTLSSDHSGSSRAPGFLGEGYEKGEGYENYIDIEGGDYRVVIYSHDETNPANSVCIGELAGIQILTEDIDEFAKKYTIRGILDAGTSGRIRQGDAVKFVFLANWHSRYQNATEGKTLDDLSQTQFGYNEDMTLLSAENRVPMFGITNPIHLQFDENNYADIGTIHLLRAYAKVEVVCADEGAVIDKVRLVRHYSLGTFAPAGVYTQDDYVHGSYDKDYTESPTIPSTAVVDATSLPFTKVDEKRWVIYVPEYDIERDPGVYPEIKIQFDGYPDEDVLYFQWYGTNSNNYFNILRNNWYRFTVRKSIYFSVKVDVMPYISVDLNPSFGFDQLLPKPNA